MPQSFLSDDRLTSILDSMGITPADIEKRKAYLELTPADIDALSSLQPLLDPAYDELLNAFYTHLQAFSETRSLLSSEELIQQLIAKQHRYFTELLSGHYDWNYVLNRLRVGLVHESVGLEPRWYIGSYCKYLNLLFSRIVEANTNTPQKLLPALQAILKVAIFDLGLVLDTYSAADRNSIMALKEYAEMIVCSVPSGLLVLDNQLTIKSANSFFDVFHANGHKVLTGKSVKDLLEIDNVISSRIREVIKSSGSQYGIEISLTDNNQKKHQIDLAIVAINSDSSQPVVQQAAALLIFEDITEKKHLQLATQKADNRIRAIMENAADGIVTIDSRGTIETFNKAAEKIFGYEASEIIGRNVSSLMPDPYQAHHDEYLHNFMHSGVRHCMNLGFREVQGRTKSGHVFDMELSISEIPMNEERVFIGIIRDISERKATESNMVKLTMALEQSADAVMITDANGKIEYVNHGFIHTTGYSAGEVISRTPAVLKSGMQGSEFYRALWSSILKGKVFREVLVNRKKNGELYYEEKTITPLKDTQGQISHFISTGRDITERMRAQERLQHMAQHDFLTTLPNRLLFMDRIAQAITRAERHGKMVAIMFLDLDRFKKINDTLGHHIGDAMLVMLSRRLQSTLREEDTIARLSGDEFAVLLQDIGDADDLPPVITKILDQFNKPFLIEQHHLYISCSIGIALYPQDGIDAVNLVKNADTAMYNAKQRGRGTFSFYAPQMNAMAEEQLYIENELRQALARNQFALVYQPQVHLGNHALIGVEALLRWQHPQRGLLGPDLFIHILEDMGLIVPVGAWVLQQSCQQLRLWLDAGLHVPQIAVNISPRQLLDEEFVDTVLEALKAADLKPEQLELEITENSLVDEEQGAITALQTLHQHGVRIAMDDFGTGYCSLSYLKYLPVDTLKIDRSFIQQIPDHAESSKLINAIIAMGQSLNLEVVAEGVETSRHYNYLCGTICNAVQGYFISHPLDADKLQEFISLNTN